MNFELTDMQKTLIQSIIEFSRDEIKIDDFKNNWKKCSEYGMFKLLLPQKYGGFDLTPLDIMLITEAFGYGCQDNGFSFSINNHLFACMISILLYGTDEQKEKYLVLLGEGKKIGSQAITEECSGSNVFNMNTIAKKTDDGYILKGSKGFISNAPIADVVIVYAKLINNSKESICSFIVERNFDGVKIGPEIKKAGLKSCPMGELELCNCFVPMDNILGSENNGCFVFNSTMEYERSYMSAANLGIMKRILENCEKFVKVKRNSGKKLIEYQSISNRIADSKVSIELSELLLYKIGWLKSNNKNAYYESSIAKLYVSESYKKLCMDAMNIHGAYGYSLESNYPKELNDAVGSCIYSGTSDIQRNIIASL